MKFRQIYRSILIYLVRICSLIFLQLLCERNTLIYLNAWRHAVQTSGISCLNTQEIVSEHPHVRRGRCVRLR